MDLIITIDTEADNAWARSEVVSTENTRFIPRFQALCDRFGFKPTYLCTYEMVQDARFQETVGPYQAAGRAEIGAHLHPWTNPPFGPGDEDGHRNHPFPHELPIESFRGKMAVLTEAIDRAFGRPPTSYRAGRYGFDGPHIEVLAGLGYRVDCSVTPYCSWTHASGRPGGRGGMDFRRARPAPYRPDPRDVCRPGAGPLLEVPVTILFTKWLLAGSALLQGAYVKLVPSSLAQPLARRGWGPRWFRPLRETTAADLIEVYDRAERAGLPCVEMMFHSSELMPGGSPLFPDDAAIERLFEVFEGTFSALAGRGVGGTTLSAFVAMLEKAGEQR